MLEKRPFLCAAMLAMAVMLSLVARLQATQSSDTNSISANWCQDQPSAGTYTISNNCGVTLASLPAGSDKCNIGGGPFDFVKLLQNGQLRHWQR